MLYSENLSDYKTICWLSVTIEAATYRQLVEKTEL